MTKLVGYQLELKTKTTGSMLCMYVCMYVWVPFLFTWNYHNIVIGYTTIQNKKLK